MTDEQILHTINNPAQLLAFSEEELTHLAKEIRQNIIDVVSKNGGHLAASLGVVELTLALLSTFDANRNKIIWDVGHQAYAYKLLTGRANIFHTLRRLNGISGFPKISESTYDHFGVGHSSTSISAALGMTMARDLENKKHHVIAIIGDGSLTAGEAFEGLNLAGHMGKRLIVILNDNEMAISQNVGALSRFLSRTLSARWVRQTRKEVLRFLRSIPRIGEKLETYALRGEWSFKSFFTPGMLFEAFRFSYIGPVDGHNIGDLRKHLQMAANVEDSPVLLHIRTQKGKGYSPAENNPIQFHGIGLFEPETGKSKKATTSIPNFTDIFSDCLTELAENNKKIIAITAAMPEGTGTEKFRLKFPTRFIDTGICEQHAVTFAAGLASQGFKPVLAIYSTFMQRAYDQIVHDVCLQNLPVIFCLDRAGLVGEDGATHHGVFDISYLRHIPNISILAPRDENMLKHSLNTALSMNGPCAIRYPRGAGFGVEIDKKYKILSPNLGEIILNGEKILLIAAGNSLHPALQAANKAKDSINFTPCVFDPIWLKPLPIDDLKKLAKKFNKWIVIEEGTLQGGFSSSILEFLNDNKILNIQITRLGIPDKFIEHGSQKQLREQVNLHVDGIIKAIIDISKG